MTFKEFQGLGTLCWCIAKRGIVGIQPSERACCTNFRLNHVRIPIGYWAYDVGPGEPYIQGQQAYLLKAIGWAKTYNLKVIIDLHGAPGSQNGYEPIQTCFPIFIVSSHWVFFTVILYFSFDNSGQRKPSPQWQNNQTNIDRTNKIIKALASQFQNQSDVVSVIAPLNECVFNDASLTTPAETVF